MGRTDQQESVVLERRIYQWSKTENPKKHPHTYRHLNNNNDGIANSGENKLSSK